MTDETPAQGKEGARKFAFMIVRMEGAKSCLLALKEIEFTAPPQVEEVESVAEIEYSPAYYPPETEHMDEQAEKQLEAFLKIFSSQESLEKGAEAPKRTGCCPDYKEFAEEIRRNLKQKSIKIRGAGIVSATDKQSGVIVFKIIEYSGHFGPPERGEYIKLLEEYLHHKWYEKIGAPITQKDCVIVSEPDPVEKRDVEIIWSAIKESIKVDDVISELGFPANPTEVVKVLTESDARGLRR